MNDDRSKPAPAGQPVPERCADCDLLNGCREYCRCDPALPPARGCYSVRCQLGGECLAAVGRPIA